MTDDKDETEEGDEGDEMDDGLDAVVMSLLDGLDELMDVSIVGISNCLCSPCTVSKSTFAVTPESLRCGGIGSDCDACEKLRFNLKVI